MDWESSDVVRFDLGPLLQGQMRISKLKNVITTLVLNLQAVFLFYKMLLENPIEIFYLILYQR